MIYLDNAATSFPKPPEVAAAVCRAMRVYGANPGRSGHRLSIMASRAVYRCRELAAAHFGLSQPENAVFTKNCTEALNIVIQSLLSEGGHCVISDLEHNSVYRPIWELERRGTARYSVAEVTPGDPEATLAAFSELLEPETKLVVCTGASNVFGIKPPVRRIAALCRERGVPFLLDAAQTAGAESYDMERDGIDFIAAPGHKGLLGPMGTGLLLCGRPELLHPLMYGGTGSASLEPGQPDYLPDMLESGTLDLPGIAGLAEGIAWVSARGAENIGRRECALAARIWDGIAKTPGLRLLTARPAPTEMSPVVSFVPDGMTGEEAAARLDALGVAARGGYHCAALAHKKMGTQECGACRLSPGPLSTAADADHAVAAAARVAAGSYLK